MALTIEIVGKEKYEVPATSGGHLRFDRANPHALAAVLYLAWVKPDPVRFNADLLAREQLFELPAGNREPSGYSPLGLLVEHLNRSAVGDVDYDTLQQLTYSEGLKVASACLDRSTMSVALVDLASRELDLGSSSSLRASQASEALSWPPKFFGIHADRVEEFGKMLDAKSPTEWTETQDRVNGLYFGEGYETGKHLSASAEMASYREACLSNRLYVGYLRPTQLRYVQTAARSATQHTMNRLSMLQEAEGREKLLNAVANAALETAMGLEPKKMGPLPFFREKVLGTP